MEGAAWQKADEGFSELRVVFSYIASKKTGAQPYNQKRRNFSKNVNELRRQTLSSR